MKKLFVCMLAGALMFSAGACSGSGGKDSGTPAPEPVYDSKELLDRYVGRGIRQNHRILRLGE